MFDKDQYNIEGDRFILRQYIARLVIDANEHKSKLRRKMETSRNREKEKYLNVIAPYYHNFYESFDELFGITSVYIHMEESTGVRKKVEKMLENPHNTTPKELIEYYQKYLFELKRNDLIELGWWEPSLKKKMVMR